MQYSVLKTVPYMELNNLDEFQEIDIYIRTMTELVNDDNNYS